MVSVVQLVEHRIVVPSVVGSSPITHPKKKRARFALFFWLILGSIIVATSVIFNMLIFNYLSIVAGDQVRRRLCINT